MSPLTSSSSLRTGELGACKASRASASMMASSTLEVCFFSDGYPRQQAVKIMIAYVWCLRSRRFHAKGVRYPESTCFCFFVFAFLTKYVSIKQDARGQYRSIVKYDAEDVSMRGSKRSPRVVMTRMTKMCTWHKGSRAGQNPPPAVGMSEFKTYIRKCLFHYYYTLRTQGPIYESLEFRDSTRARRPRKTIAENYITE